MYSSSWGRRIGNTMEDLLPFFGQRWKKRAEGRVAWVMGMLLDI
jgi:hypothetical protein